MKLYSELFFFLQPTLLTHPILVLDPGFVGALGSHRHLLGDLCAVRKVPELRRTVLQDLHMLVADVVFVSGVFLSLVDLVAPLKTFG